MTQLVAFLALPGAPRPDPATLARMALVILARGTVLYLFR